MTLDEMCIMAARLSDRADEFEKTEVAGEEEARLEYQDDALLYFNVFKDAINEAYMEVARECLYPDAYFEEIIPEDRLIDLVAISPSVYKIKNVLNEHKLASLAYNFYTQTKIEVLGGAVGDKILIYYFYMPSRLDAYDDEPIFSESVVDPMIYVTLAVARIWQSERKTQLSNAAMAEYYTRLRNMKNPRPHDGRRVRMPPRRVR